jgi:hypothetical protein
METDIPRMPYCRLLEAGIEQGVLAKYFFKERREMWYQERVRREG